MCGGGGMPFGFGAQLNGTHARLADESKFAACRGVVTSCDFDRPYLGPSPAGNRFASAGEGHSPALRYKLVVSVQRSLLRYEVRGCLQVGMN